jgi:hypothetical protein
MSPILTLKSVIQTRPTASNGSVATLKSALADSVLPDCPKVKESVRIYNPSQAEEEWYGNGGAIGKICQIAARPSQKEAAKNWLSYSRRVFDAHRQFSPPTVIEDSALSHFTTGDNRREAIEPIHGFGRHPYANIGCPGGTVSIFDITHIIIANRCGSQKAAVAANCKGRNIFFDLGASVGFQGIPGGLSKNANSASGGGSSVPLFMAMYLNHCIDFDDIFAWEFKGQNQNAWWGELPPDYRRRVRFYNVGVAEKYDSNGLPVVNPNSFLELLKSHVKREDFVAVKVDIDTPNLENPLVNTLANNPEYGQLVDEIFFEHHVYMDGMNIWGGETMNRARPPNIDHSLALFRKLRKLGIRAHFWI